jgi:hypothetical protein
MMKMGIGTSDLFGMHISDFVPRSNKLLGRRVYKKPILLRWWESYKFSEKEVLINPNGDSLLATED